MYVSKNICKVNDLPPQIFLKKYAKIKPDRLSSLKKFDSSLIPSCQEVLQLKIKRHWVSAIVAHLADVRPEEFGWTFGNDGRYIIKWCEGPSAQRVLDVTISEDTEPLTENATEGTYKTYKAVTIQVPFCGKLK